MFPNTLTVFKTKYYKTFSCTKIRIFTTLVFSKKKVSDNFQ